MRLCIVGGGLTGAKCAALVRKALPAAHIELWDKARRFGGRMCTKRSPSEPRICDVDVGAQYISTIPESDQYKYDYNNLIAEGVLIPLTCQLKGDRHPSNSKHYIAPCGMSSVVDYYVKKASCTTKVSTLVTNLSKQSERSWKVITDTGEEAIFDAVVLTLPVPQLLGLKGDIQTDLDSSSNLRSNLEQVKYSSRFCLGIFYPASEKDKIVEEGSAAVSYLSEEDYPFCYLAVDTVKRGLNADEIGGVSIMVHTSVKFSAENIDVDKEKMLPILLQKFKKLRPQYPEPEISFCHKWRFSQVTNSFPPPHDGSISLSDGSLILTGDAFTNSKVEGCFTAAKSVD